MKDEFIGAFKEALEIEDRELSLEDEFREYEEWGSLAQLSLIVMLDENFGVEIEVEDFEKLITLEDLMNEVKKRSGK